MTTYHKSGEGSDYRGEKPVSSGRASAGSLFRLRILLVLIGVSSALIGCDASTSRLTPAQEAQFQAEGVRRRADDVMFRYTSDPGGRSERREDRRASIIVTGSSVLIHKNEKVGLKVSPRTRRDVAVERSDGRIRIRAGRGRSEEIWSFEPDDPAGWAADIRNAVKQDAQKKR
ncbi:MAG TPA: hypothetical protein VF042_11955 [Gemmatimonadaceae bacterium]